MSIWPYWPVWPLLLVACGLASLWNWRAGLAFAAVIMAMQGVKALDLAQPQVIFFALYVTAGLIAWAFLDRIAGFTMAIVGFVYLLHILGVIPHYPKVIIAEALIVFGLIIGAFNGGQSGGLLAMDWSGHSGGPSAARAGGQGGVARDQSTAEKD